VSYIARKHGIAPSMLYQWRRAMEDGALTAVNNVEKVVPHSDVRNLEERVRRLERLLGQKTEENECLKEAVQLAREKKLISRAPLRGIKGFQ
ncbi:MAG: IS3 family transposase, partial [Oxalobacteraceae bacterium]